MAATTRRPVALVLAVALLVGPPAAPARAQERASPGDVRGARLRTAGWAGLAATVALLAAGGVFGLTARSRSNDLAALLAGRDASGQAPPFDARTEAKVATLQSEGREADRIAIGFFAAGAVTGVAAAVLFTAAALRRPAPLTLAPTASREGAGVQVLLRF